MAWVLPALPRIALVTARRARRQVEEAAREVAEATGWEVDVVEAPVEIAALIPRDVLEKIVSQLKGYDLVIVPGGIGYSLDEIAARHGVRLVRGPRDADGLRVLAELGEDGLQRLAEAGELSPSLLLDKWLEELRRHHTAAPGLRLCSLRVPLRPPPVIVAAEVYARREKGIEGLVEEARRLARHGADMIVVGPPQGWGKEEIVEAARLVGRETGLPVALDTPDVEAAADAVREGYACMYMSVGLWNRGAMDVLPGGTAVVVLPLRADYSLPPSPLGRVEALRGLVEEAGEKGLSPIADPVLDPPGQGSLGLSIASYYLASYELPETPLMAGLANFYELMDADSHGQIAALTQILAESGASIMLVTEASPKTRMAVTEARIAATMTSLSLLKRRQPKDLGLDLLYAKEKRPAPPSGGVPRKPRLVLDAHVLARWHGFRLDRAGSHRIRLQEDGAIVDYYIGRRGTLAVRGHSGEDLYRAAAYLGLASEPSHYAYLGYELCKAEHAARMRRSYRQDEPLLTPPWARGYRVYIPAAESARELRLEGREKSRVSQD